MGIVTNFDLATPLYGLLLQHRWTKTNCQSKTEKEGHEGLTPLIKFTHPSIPKERLLN